MSTETSYSAAPKAEPVTVKSLWNLYTEAKIIPMRFKPTGETVYVTPRMRDWIERGKRTLYAKEAYTLGGGDDA